MFFFSPFLSSSILSVLLSRYISSLFPPLVSLIFSSSPPSGSFTRSRLGRPPLRTPAPLRRCQGGQCPQWAGERSSAIGTPSLSCPTVLCVSVGKKERTERKRGEGRLLDNLVTCWEIAARKNKNKKKVPGVPPETDDSFEEEQNTVKLFLLCISSGRCRMRSAETVGLDPDLDQSTDPAVLSGILKTQVSWSWCSLSILNSNQCDPSTQKGRVTSLTCFRSTWEC